MAYDPERDEVIAFIVECIAQGLLHRLGVTAPPAPVLEMLERLPPPWRPIKLMRVPILPWPAMHASDEEQGDIILLHQGLAPELERVAVAREMFRFLIPRLNAKGIWTGPLDRPSVWANWFGRCLLLPANWIGGGEPIEVAAVARRFGVTEALADQRLRELKLM